LPILYKISFMEYFEFSENEVKMATYLLALENNAFLRVMISQNIKIMQKLGIEVEIPRNAADHLIPGTKLDEHDPYPLIIDTIEEVAAVLQHRVWEYLQMNTKTPGSKNE
jgi:hypothetical protein